MTDFDTRLQTSLERLDAAIPVPRPPSVSADGQISRAQPMRRKRRRRVVFLLAAAAVLAASSAVTAQRIFYPDVAAPVLEAAIVEILDRQDCISAADASAAIRARMDELGYADWDIRLEGGAEGVRCASAGIVPPDHLVIILGAVGREVAEAMDGVRDELMTRCLNKAEAIVFVKSVLASIGRTDIGVRADPGGPQGAPVDQIDAYKAHVAAGCYVYSGMPDRQNVHLWGP